MTNETQPKPDKHNGFRLETDFAPIFAGRFSPPNFEPISDNMALAHIATGYAKQGHGQIKLPNGDKFNSAHYFLTTTFRGPMDGTGIVVWYGEGGKGYAGTFAICMHEKQSDPGANPNRGWHPGHCVKCGLDMTIDSGD